MTQESTEQLVEKTWRYLGWPLLLILGVAIGAQFLENTFLILATTGIVFIAYVAVRAHKDDQLTGILLLAGAFTGFTVGFASSITKMIVHQKIWLIFGVISEPVVLASIGILFGFGIAFLMMKMQPIIERR